MLPIVVINIKIKIRLFKKEIKNQPVAFLFTDFVSLSFLKLKTICFP